MFVRSGDHPGHIDSVMAVEGSFVHGLEDGEPTLKIKMLYLNNVSRATFGTCDITSKALFSPQTLEKFRAFAASAEEDFGKLVFKEGAQLPYLEGLGVFGQAESTKGLGEG